MHANRGPKQQQNGISNGSWRQLQVLSANPDPRTYPCSQRQDAQQVRKPLGPRGASARRRRFDSAGRHPRDAVGAALSGALGGAHGLQHLRYRRSTNGVWRCGQRGVTRCLQRLQPCTMHTGLRTNRNSGSRAEPVPLRSSFSAASQSPTSGMRLSGPATEAHASSRSVTAPRTWVKDNTGGTC